MAERRRDAEELGAEAEIADLVDECCERGSLYVGAVRWQRLCAIRDRVRGAPSAEAPTERRYERPPDCTHSVLYTKDPSSADPAESGDLRCLRCGELVRREEKS